MTLLGLCTAGFLGFMMCTAPTPELMPVNQETVVQFTPADNGVLNIKINSSITSAAHKITISFTEEDSINVNYGELVGYLNRTFEPANIYFEIVEENAEIPVIIIDEREGYVGHAVTNGYAFRMPAYVDLNYGITLEAQAYAVAHEIGHLLGLPHGEGLMQEKASPDVEFCKITKRQAKIIQNIL